MLKNAFFTKIIKNVKTVLYIYWVCNFHSSIRHYIMAASLSRRIDFLNIDIDLLSGFFCIVLYSSIYIAPSTAVGQHRLLRRRSTLKNALPWTPTRYKLLIIIL